MNELELLQPEGNKVTKVILGNARIIMMALILFTVVVVMTTDIRFATITDIRDLGLDFFILLFCSYGMYICCTDGGIKAGHSSDAYKAAVKRFGELRGSIEENHLDKMGEFCNHYIEEELRKTRMQYLSVVCIPYDVYLDKYVKLDKNEIEALTDITCAQKKALKNANKVKPIKLTPEKIMTQGKAVHTRSALTISPEMMKVISRSIKMFKMGFTTFFTILIALDIILEPSWTVFAGVCFKLATVVINGFDGHKDGYNNVIYTINYMNNQSVLMQRAIQYAEANPTTQMLTATSEATT